MNSKIKPAMTIMRAIQSGEDDIECEQVAETEIVNAEWDGWAQGAPRQDGSSDQMTLYGRMGGAKAYYIVLNKEAVELIREPIIGEDRLQRLTSQEMVNLGIAIGSFSVGQIDQGIHAVLPMIDTETGELCNPNFQSLVDEHFNKIQHELYRPNQIGMAYIQCVRDWIKENGIKYITV